MALNIFGTQSLKLKFDGGYQDELFFTQADSGRVLQVQVLDENNQVIYAEGLTLEFYIGSATEVTKVEGILQDAEEGIFLVKLEDTQLTYSGMYKSQFVLKNRAGERLGSKQINTRVEGSIENGDTLGLNALVSFEDVQRVTDLLTQYDTNLEEGLRVNEELRANSAEASRINRTIVTAIDQANTTNNQIQSAVALVTQSLSTIDAKSVEVTAIINTLDSLNTSGTALQTSLQGVINNANTAKTNLDGSVTNAQSINTNLRDAIQQGNNLNVQLAGLTNAITEATAIETELTNNIAEAISIRDALNNSANTAQSKIDTLNALHLTSDTKISNINVAIENADTARSNLNSARTLAEATETALNEIIASGNLENYITQPKLTSTLVEYLSKTEASTQYATKTELANIDLTDELANLATKAELATKTDLTDFNPVKTKVDGIESGANKTVVSNTLTSSSITEALSANQGRILNQNQINAKTLDKALDVYGYGLDLNNAPSGITYLSANGNYANHPFPDTGGAGITNKEAYLYTSPPLTAGHITTKIQVITSIEGKQQLRSSSNNVWGDWKELSPSLASETTDGLLSKTDFTKLQGVETGAQKNNVTEVEKAAWNNKVDKVSGMGLSKNDYTDVEKTKLAGIATGANNYTHPSTHPASMITESTTKRFVTDAEKSTWSGKQDTLTAGTNVTINGNTISATDTTYGLASASADGLMSSADKTKLDELNYTRAMTEAAYEALSQAEKDRLDVWYGIYE